MRKRIITSAILLGSIGANAGSFSFEGKLHSVELSSGKKIEIIIQQEMPDDNYFENEITLQTDLTRQVLNHEKMLQLLNKIRKDEQEVNEELNL